MSEIEAVVEEMQRRYAAAVLAKDADGLRALYNPDVRVFDAWDSWSYDSLDAWGRTIADWFGSLGDDRCSVEFTESREYGCGDMAVVTAFVTYANLAPDGSVQMALTNRITWGLVKTANGWKIAHEHTSSPGDFVSKKVLTARR